MKTEEKALLVISHLTMFLARTGFGLLVPLIMYLNSRGEVKEGSLDTLKFQAKITFTYLGLQFVAIIYQIVTSFIASPALTMLNFAPYNPLTVISLLSQLVITAGIVFAVFGAILTASGKTFRYPRLWLPAKKKSVVEKLLR